jgi:hypothetical protein
VMGKKFFVRFSDGSFHFGRFYLYRSSRNWSWVCTDLDSFLMYVTKSTHISVNDSGLMYSASAVVCCGEMDESEFVSYLRDSKISEII